MPALEKYIVQFSRLNVAKGRDNYPALTYHCAPHKPILLLSVIDLIAGGQITKNLIEPSFELVDTFNGYWSIVMPPERRGLMTYPFYYMRSEKFWELIPKPGYEDKPGRTFSSMIKIREYYSGARLEESLFILLIDQMSRERLRNVLVQTYFVPEIQPQILSQGFVNVSEYIYAHEVISSAAEKIEHFPEHQKVRDQGFRKAIVQLYDHRCSLCGIRMRTPEGHTVVEAAHIVPWNKSQDDLPSNGLCLCRLCHWSFDEGLMSVSPAYKVLVSNRVRIDDNMPGHILTLTDRPIFKPEEKRFWPGQENLEHHRKKCFA